MPGLIRGMARTAAVVGTATATRNAVNRHQAEKNYNAYANAQNTYNQQTAPPPQQYVEAPQQYQSLPPQQGYEAPPQVEYVAAPAQDDMIAQLEKLGQLKAQGLLTDEEFAAAKAKLING